MNNHLLTKNIRSQNNAGSQPLIDYINQMFPLKSEIVDFIRQNTFAKKLAKGKFLLRQGEVCSHYYYIHKGVLRSFLKFGKKEITIWINPENEITTSIRSMNGSRPSDEYIQALEECELVVIPFDAMEALYDRFPEMNMVGRKLLQEYYAASEERVYICRIPDARSRYQHFIDTRPELVNRTPLKYVASYLGITLETLSRLRSRKASKLA
jgi:CRP-like cAMP-binding protein